MLRYRSRIQQGESLWLQFYGLAIHLISILAVIQDLAALNFQRRVGVAHQYHSDGNSDSISVYSKSVSHGFLCIKHIVLHAPTRQAEA